MNSVEFIRTVSDVFETELRVIARKFERGQRHAIGPFSFPTILRIAETPNHFIAELCGGTGPRPATQTRLQKPSTPEQARDATTFFNGGFDGGDPENAMVISGDYTNIENVTLSSRYDAEVFSRKVNYPLANSQVIGKHSDTPLGIRSTTKRLLFRNVDIVRTDHFRVLFRSILTAICVEKNLTAPELRRWLMTESTKGDRRFGPLVLNLSSGPSPYSFGRELASLSDQDVKESVLDVFIQSHGDYFRKALNYKAFLSQPVLEWLDRTDVDPFKSIPDYLLQRADGYWDILDLKKALLRPKSIVRGLPSRPRFIDYVDEMIAQLVRYRGYFDRPKNAHWVEEHLGIRVKDVRLIGVVGNYDSFDSHHVDLAMQQYCKNITIMSYSDVVNLLRKSERPH